MNRATATTASTASRLVRFLTELDVTQARVSHKHFADKLGKLVDLSDAFTLSDELRSLPRLTFEPATTQPGNIKAQFLQARSQMVENIIRSFVPDAVSMPFNLPLPDAEPQAEKNSAFEPYLRLYATHQSELEFRIIKLRGQVRQALAGVSRELAQLVALDTALGDTLAGETRRLLAVIPRLLGKRFHFLQARSTNNDEASPDGWLQQFYTEMQGLLLAELELRLQPVVGLIEALDEEEERKR